MAAKKKAATNGAADTDTTKQPNPHETVHAQHMEELAAQQRAHRNAEFAEQGMTPVHITDEMYEGRRETPAPDPVQVKEKAPPADPPAINIPDPVEADPGEYVPLKVDGVETRVEKAKVLDAGIRALQKESTADKRLQEITSREQELKRREEEVQRQADELNARLANNGGDELPLDEAEIASIVQELKYGDDAKTANGLKKVIKAAIGAKATKGGNLTRAEVQAIAREERERGSFESALREIKKPQNQGGFGDLFDGGILENAFAFEDERLSKDPDGQKLPYLDRMKKAGEAVRQKLKPTNGSGSPNNDSVTNAQRNAGLEDTPVSAGGGGAPAGGKQQQRTQETESQRHARLLEEANKQRKGPR